MQPLLESTSPVNASALENGDTGTTSLTSSIPTMVRSVLVDPLVQFQSSSSASAADPPPGEVERQNREMVEQNMRQDTENAVSSLFGGGGLNRYESVPIADEGDVTTGETNANLVAQRRQYIVVGFFLFLLIAIDAFMLFFLYLAGWWVLIWNWWKPCDQPLAGWLAFYLIFLPADIFFSHKIRRIVYESFCCWSPSSGDPQPARVRLIQGLYLIFQFEIYISAITFIHKCETCQDTNPHLFSWVDFWIWQGLFLLLGLYLLGVCCVIAVIALLRGGYLVNRAADPEVLQQMETVDPEYVETWDGEYGRPPRECAICYENFCKTKVIKRTPCRHVFHEECLGKWLSAQRTCPLCRVDLQKAVLDPQDLIHVV